MVARAAAPTAAIQRVPFAIGPDHDGRQASLADVGAAILAGTDAGQMVAVAVIGDPMQWTIFADLAELVGTERPGLTIVAEPGITSYQAAAAAAVVPLGRSGSPMVVLDGAGDLDRDLDDGERSVVLYKASTDAAALKEAGRRNGRDDAIVSELTGLPGQRVVPLASTDDGPISYLATVIFPARRTARAQVLP
jgi:precorrin-2/cobalt-factor-2 C20-methyltransferase